MPFRITDITFENLFTDRSWELKSKIPMEQLYFQCSCHFRWPDCVLRKKSTPVQYNLQSWLLQFSVSPAATVDRNAGSQGVWGAARTRP